MSIKTLYKVIDSSSHIVVRCPICFELMTFGHYLHKHALQEYSLKNRQECVFCMGLKSWPHGQRMKRENVKHVVECLKSFVNPQNNASTVKNYEDLEEEICDCQTFVSIPRDMLGRSKNMDNVILYESVFEKPDMWSDDGVQFSESSGLGKDVYGIVQRYLKKDLKWFHVMVKHDAFQIFCREMEKIQNEIVVLPFWCLCDGLMAGIAKVQHRHMIIACELQGQFEFVWQRKFRYNIPNGKAKKRIRIENVFHLVRTIASKNVVNWEEAAVRVTDTNRHLKWVVPIKVTGWKFLNCAIPLDRRFESTKEGTPLYLTLYNDKKMYVKEGNGADREECSLRCIRGEMYILSPKQQSMMNQIETVKNKVITVRNFYWQNKLAVCFVERDVLRKEMAHLRANKLL
ncbi:uncharacterized protein TNCV_4978321 [Trichonephila clavipes]|nr:uncharacterized protein TNCV_4978321 [Trichonephila clavipes]